MEDKYKGVQPSFWSKQGRIGVNKLFNLLSTQAFLGLSLWLVEAVAVFVYSQTKLSLQVLQTRLGALMRRHPDDLYPYNSSNCQHYLAFAGITNMKMGK